MRERILRVYLWSLGLPMAVHLAWLTAVFCAVLGTMVAVRLGVAAGLVGGGLLYAFGLVLYIPMLRAKGIDPRRPTPEADAIAARVRSRLDGP